MSGEGANSPVQRPWRSLEELADRPEIHAALAEAFPSITAVPRRHLFKLMGGAIALAGLDGCERLPNEEALPYVEAPDGETTGKARYYATAVEHDGISHPITGKTRDGRPIKIEGSQSHPASGGATDAFTQASLLGLYDPARSGEVLHRGRPLGWDGWGEAIVRLRARNDENGGDGFRLLTGPVGSPTMRRQIADLLERWPGARWHEHRPLADMRRERLLLERAHAVVALDHDVIGPGPLQTFHARGWGARRQAFQRGDGSAQLFVAEPSPTITGVSATQRLPLREGRVPVLLQVLVRSVEGAGGAGDAGLTTPERQWVREAAAALRANRGRSLVTVGPHHPAATRAQAHALNARLGNRGVTSIALPPQDGPQPEAFEDLPQAMQAGAVECLFVLDANPAYASPAAARFAEAMGRVPLRLHAGLHADETAALCHWHAPLAHDFESWRDGEAADGSIIAGQPLVRPWLPVRSRGELLAGLLDDPREERERLRARWPQLQDETAWERVLLGAPIAPAPAGSPPPPVMVGSAAVRARQDHGELALSIRPDPSVWDGRFASNPWLQELPKPLTKIAWQNAVHISPALARERRLENGDLVRVSAGGAAVEGPVWILPGQDRHSILLHLGGGRPRGGPVADGAGFNAWPLVGARGEVVLTALGGNDPVCTTQHHFKMEGDEFVRFVDQPEEALPPEPHKDSFYPPQVSDPAWGMAIDLDLCIGCNACVVACVAENNVPMVGREQVAMGREMHWLRVDRYYQGEPDNPQHAFQPVPCMHCEDAPCEMGCPVNATVHSPDGLNLQVYNRCIGTRTCSAYCPYKVRRFNWFDLTGDDPPELKAVRNPEVTVRQRGVMEKCTYCIQRISTARIAAKEEDRPIADGEVVTACQAACPTNAIVFGNTAHEDTAVSRRKASPRNYDLLPEANTRPRTTYAARIRGGKGEA
ncbi:molybdopterin oxidoreductase [Altererythrobacter sp. B11]|uniref:TAT-variant-translocated molybdopterin oxidoreductase n=1 Tax=Altererythrobacter sp. B11 TaxID=2060312 RepID=UPI000DC70D93|nr:TAT-variant-translocated molybdopterin oxidoreductase [Altererythrobacter sp. B11]BBC72770.1 molybdopterin oxidoreductase [Altererythrobacter sp. B11]